MVMIKGMARIEEMMKRTPLPNLPTMEPVKMKMHLGKIYKNKKLH
jgi:hypothetical protein